MFEISAAFFFIIIVEVFFFLFLHENNFGISVWVIHEKLPTVEVFNLIEVIYHDHICREISGVYGRCKTD